MHDVCKPNMGYGKHALDKYIIKAQGKDYENKKKRYQSKINGEHSSSLSTARAVASELTGIKFDVTLNAKVTKSIYMGKNHFNLPETHQLKFDDDTYETVQTKNITLNNGKYIKIETNDESMIEFIEKLYPSDKNQ